MKRSTLNLWFVLIILLSGCSSTPERSEHTYSSNQYHRAVEIAMAQIGSPYRYGGSSPSKGFDCSGLVYYSYRKAGIKVPRDSRSQLRASRTIPKSRLKPGDLLFYNISGNPSHVAIYIGQGKFVHAPSSGKKVMTSNMNDAYWRKRLYRIGQITK